MSEQSISVIVPTYKRAHLLSLTLPTYLQPETSELIVVDDCSPDKTREVVESLAADDPRIRYIRTDANRKQPHAKNLGISHAHGEYLYFGDDDSVLLPGSLERLITTLHDYGALIVGACAPYITRLSKDKDFSSIFEEILGEIEQSERLQKTKINKRLIDPVSLEARFDIRTKEPVEVPFVQASFLVSRELAEKIGFDEHYFGNCYREETDFLIRAHNTGAKIIYEPRAIQANLPRSIAIGGAHDGSSNFLIRKLSYFKSALGNNWYFLTKNKEDLQKAFGLNISPLHRQAVFAMIIMRVIVSYPLRKVIGHEL